MLSFHPLDESTLFDASLLDAGRCRVLTAAFDLPVHRRLLALMQTERVITERECVQPLAGAVADARLGDRMSDHHLPHACRVDTPGAVAQPLTVVGSGFKHASLGARRARLPGHALQPLERLALASTARIKAGEETLGAELDRQRFGHAGELVGAAKVAFRRIVLAELEIREPERSLKIGAH
ncbi:MAG: hypothetical protein Q8M01_18205 [Rubrivivax sp.]|nr:hypothetical protein [Rubrivivax sp.]